MDHIDYKYRRLYLWMGISLILLYPVVHLVLDEPFDRSFWFGLGFLLLMEVPVVMGNLERKKSKRIKRKIKLQGSV